MGEDAGQDLGSAQWSRLPAPTRLTIRERLSRWIAPRPQISREYEALMLNQHANAAKEKYEMQDLGSVSAFTFSVVAADNGKIIKYRTPLQETSNTVRGGRIEGSISYGLYIVPEGDKLIEAIAAIITKHRLQ